MAQKGTRRRTGSDRQSWRGRLRGVLHDVRPRRITPQRFAFGLVCVVLYTLILSPDLVRTGTVWRAGHPAPYDVIADRTMPFIDESATEQWRQAKADAVPRQYVSRDAEVEVINLLARWFEEVAGAAKATGAEREEKLATLAAHATIRVPRAALERAARLDAERRKRLADLAERLVADLYHRQEIRDDQSRESDPDMQAARRLLATLLRDGVADADDRTLLAAVLGSPKLLPPNRVFDPRETERLRDEARRDAEPVLRVINRGEQVVQRGRQVTTEQIGKLRALGVARKSQGPRGLLGMVCLIFLTTLVLSGYVRAEVPEVYADLGKLALLNVVCMAALLAFRLLMSLKVQLPMLAHPGIACGATVGMLVTALLDYRLSMMATSALALFLGMLLPGAGLWVAFEAWLGGRVGAMSLRHVTSRADLVRSALNVALGGMVIAVVMQMPRAGDDSAYGTGTLVRDLLFGLGWGTLAFLVAQGLMPILERLFGVVTPFRLLEMTNTSTPLLQELKRQARGSFDASLTIGDMAAEACDAIRADSLLARAAGYYHDIGKLRHPTWFAENQFGRENIHERLEPTVSAMAIKSHVSEGLELADQFNLPKGVREVIAQHHGTGLISFFYYQACERAGGAARVDEDRFRYDGPRPQTREAGVIMLADGVEAAVRAVSGHGPLNEKRMGELVQKIIDQRLQEGQLAECDLTLRDLTLIAESFMEYLRGMYHSRIDYPEQALAAARKRNGRGSATEGGAAHGG